MPDLVCLRASFVISPPPAPASLSSWTLSLEERRLLTCQTVHAVLQKEGRNNERAKSVSPDRSAEVAADLETKSITAKTRPLWPHPTTCIDKQDVSKDEVTTPVAQNLQAEIETLQDVVEHHFLTAEVKEELHDFFDKKEKGERKDVWSVSFSPFTVLILTRGQMERKGWNNQQNSKGDGTPC
jgi:hypothetical protein